jgi:hypothetical protein
MCISEGVRAYSIGIEELHGSNFIMSGPNGSTLLTY